MVADGSSSAHGAFTTPGDIAGSQAVASQHATAQQLPQNLVSPWNTPALAQLPPIPASDVAPHRLAGMAHTLEHNTHLIQGCLSKHTELYKYEVWQVEFKQSDAASPSYLSQMVRHTCLQIRPLQIC